jgi:ubiquinone/menaquinone biosynthesis C-methylase UbiE
VSIAERVFAAVYDPLNAAAERGWMGRRRSELLAGARGRVLEIGAGTGANLRHYPPTVDELVVVEPSKPMRARLAHHLASAPLAVRVSGASADDLPFPDDSFDTVVATLVLCTVPDVEATLAEVRRVLRPGGQLLFLEHGGDASGSRGRWQHRLDPVWSRVACGCHLTRDARRGLEAAGFVVDDYRQYEPRGVPGILRPIGQGTAS